MAKARRSDGGAAATPALAVLAQAKTPHTLHRYDDPPPAASYGEAVATALGVDPHRLFKTLVVALDAGQLAVGIVPVSATLDLRAIAAALGTKRATMAAPADAERSTGYVTGGISPLGQRRALATVLDESATTWDTIFVSAGRRGLQVEIAPAALAALTGATSAAIASG